MRRAAPLALLLLLLAEAAAAQHEGVGAAAPRLPGVPDVPEGPGTLRGQIVHATRQSAAAGLPVVLYALPAGGPPGLRGAVADASGAFRFEQLSTDPATAYLVGVSFADVPFGTRVAFAPGRTEQEVRVEISDPSADVAGIEPGALRLRLERGCAGLRVTEFHALANPGERVIAVPPGSRGEAWPVFEVPLPAGATGFGAASGVQGSIELDAGQVRFWGPLYPGTATLEFSYSLPVEDGRVALERRLPAGASRVEVESHRHGPLLLGDAFRPDGDPDAEGWQTASRGALAPGASLAFELEVVPAPAAADGLALSRAQMWLELDEAALKVDERYELETGGNAPLRAGSDAPLLCLPLPEGADALRFSTAALAMGLTQEGASALALRGPIPAGTSQLALSYLLPTRATPVAFERRLPLAVPWLSLYLADTGLVVESARLHRRRPVLTEDRTYLQLEAFEVAAGEPVLLTLAPLPAPRGMPRLAVAALLAAAALAALAFLAAPLRRERRAEEPVASAVSLEREGIYAAIRDLDHDFETGKLAEEDYESFRRELRARAVALLRQERRAAERAATAPPPDACAGCGAALGEDARFCSQCGLALHGRAPGQSAAT